MGKTGISKGTASSFWAAVEVGELELGAVTEPGADAGATRVSDSASALDSDQALDAWKTWSARSGANMSALRSQASGVHCWRVMPASCRARGGGAPLEELARRRPARVRHWVVRDTQCLVSPTSAADDDMMMNTCC